MYKIFFYGHFTTLISTKVLFESILNEGKSEIRQKNARQKVWMRKRKFHFYYVAKKIFNHKDWKASRISTLLPKISSSSEVRNILTIAKCRRLLLGGSFCWNADGCRREGVEVKNRENLLTS